MRGIPSAARFGGGSKRISPAHAGNTSYSLTNALKYADQPRTCGEYGESSRGAILSRGSAPHMRGILETGEPVAKRAGISPAHAGNTTKRNYITLSITDQPRTCGEYVTDSLPTQPPRGSAPHMRGIQLTNAPNVNKPRISPAHAGNTSSTASPRACSQDQPRTCGEYI